MTNATKQFSTEDRKRIGERIAALETRTDAEVVCAVATESGRYDRAEALCGLAVGLLALAVGNKLLAMAQWDGQASLGLGWQTVLIVLGFVLGNVLASYGHAVRRFWVSRAEMKAEVTRRAHQVFSQYGIGETRHRGGLLIYVSLFEHRLEIRGDRAVAMKLTDVDLESIRDAALEQIRQGQLTEGLIAALDKAEGLLAQALPASDQESSALSNELLLFHPRP